MTASEFREALIAAFRDLTGVEPPSIEVKGDEKAGFTATFATAVYGRDPSAMVRDFRSAALLFSTANRANVEASKALGQQATAEDLFRLQLMAAQNPESSGV